MATVTKTWAFDTNTESFILSDQGGNGTGSLTWDNNGYLKYLYTNASPAVEDFNATLSLSAEVSWESLGVPVSATVTSIELTNIDIATDGTNPGGNVDLDAALIASITVTDGVSTVATVLSNYTLPTIDEANYFFDTFYGTGGNGVQSVGTNHRASNTTVKLNIILNYITLGNTTANLSNFFDTISLNINYDPPPSSGPTRRYYIIT
jgi:hypothetical protein